MAIAGNIYKHKKTKKSAVVSGLVAALVMGIVSVFSNYFVVYPVYYKAGMAEEAILQMYQAIAKDLSSKGVAVLDEEIPEEVQEEYLKRNGTIPYDHLFLFDSSFNGGTIG